MTATAAAAAAVAVPAPAPAVTAAQFLAGARHRRTVYALQPASPVPDARIRGVVEEVLAFAPSSFNTRPVRATLVLGAAKQREFWDLVAARAEPALRAAGDAVWEAMRARIEGYRNSYGSVVFWTSTKIIEDSAAQHPAAGAAFREFGEHSQGMAQILVWSALELEGLGANLQHFQAVPGIEAALKAFLGVPDDYALKAHLNFGAEAQPHPDAPPAPPAAEMLSVVQ